MPVPEGPRPSARPKSPLPLSEAFPCPAADPLLEKAPDGPIRPGPPGCLPSSTSSNPQRRARSRPFLFLPRKKKKIILSDRPQVPHDPRALAAARTIRAAAPQALRAYLSLDVLRNRTREKIPRRDQAPLPVSLDPANPEGRARPMHRPNPPGPALSLALAPYFSSLAPSCWYSAYRFFLHTGGRPTFLRRTNLVSRSRRVSNDRTLGRTRASPPTPGASLRPQRS